MSAVLDSHHDPADAPASRPLAIIRLCARRTLSPQMRERLVARGNDLSEGEWLQVVEMARGQRVAAFVFLHIAEAGLLPVVPATVTDALRREYQTTLLSNRRMQTVEAELLRRLGARGIRVLALKGLALTFRYYGELGLRPITDIDLLVERANVPAVCAVLREMEYHPSSGSGSPNGFNAQTHAVVDYLRERSPQIEIHWELFNSAAYRAGLEAREVWQRAERIELLGHSVSYLSTADELLYLSVHFAAEHQLSRLLWAVDIAELIRALPASWDWSAFVRRAIEARMARPLALTLSYCRDNLELHLPSMVLDELWAAADSREEQTLYRAAQASFPSADWIRTQAAVLRGPVEWAIFLRGVLLPRGPALAELYGPASIQWPERVRTHLRHLRRMARELAAGLPL